MRIPPDARIAIGLPRPGVWVTLAAAAVVTFAACGSPAETLPFDNSLPQSTAPAAPRETFRAATIPTGGSTSGSMATIGTGPYASSASTEAVPGSSAAPSDPGTPPVSSTTSVVSVHPPAPTDEPESTVPAAPPTSRPGAPPTTAGPTTVPAASGPTFPFPTLYDVPELGDDPVRGSGCGLLEDLPEKLPDGVWFGLLAPTGEPSKMAIDVVCAYYGEAAVDMGATESQSQLFPVNRATRLRQIDLGEAFAYRVGVTYAFTCVDPGAGADQPLSEITSTVSGWVVISGGVATLAISLCA